MRSQSRSGPGSKTRTGCKTCKCVDTSLNSWSRRFLTSSKRLRRVKCDEGKPTCKRCRDMYLECGGYVPQESRNSKKTEQRLLPLLPKAPKIPKTSTALVPGPPPRQFANDQEFQCFKFYCDTTATNLGEYLDMALFSHIVLQASEQESFIRHGVMALGALSRAVKAKTTTEDHLVGESQGIKHYRVAFQQYGKSIQGIRKACKEERKSKRTILIACLLAICFEYFHGNVNLAIAHIQNGVKLSKSFLKSPPCPRFHCSI